MNADKRRPSKKSDASVIIDDLVNQFVERIKGVDQDVICDATDGLIGRLQGFLDNVRPRPTPGLTPRRLQVLRIIDSAIRTKGYAPSFREIAANMGISSATVHEHIHAMIADGFLTKRGYRGRTIAIAPHVRILRTAS